MDGMTFLADPLCCTETGPHYRCRIMDDKERMMARKDTLLAGPSCGGISIIEHIETQLDQVIRALTEAAAGEMQEEPTEAEKALWRGQAQGLCEALAIIRNPYLPNIVAIKAEAMERYEAGLVPGELIPQDEVLANAILSVESPRHGLRLVHNEILDALVQAAPPKVQAAYRQATGQTDEEQ